MNRLTHGLAIAALLSGSIAAAAEADDARVTASDTASRAQPRGLSYEAGFFAQYSPRTALDMVRAVPSFALRDGEQERRGYSGAVGNVLIDGKRPSAKSQSLEDILQRIPASQVVRIEVLRGGEAAADPSGDAVLVNVVRTASAGTGVWSGGFEYAQQHEPAPNGFLSWSGRVAALDYGLGLNSYSLKRELPGMRRTRDAAGSLIGSGRERSPRDFAEYAFSGEIGHDLYGGRLRATGQAYRSDYEQANTLDMLDAQDQFTGDQLLPYAEDKRSAEVGLHFDTALGPWNWTLAAILNRTTFDSEAGVTHRDASLAVVSQFQQLQRRDSGESILRTTWSRSLAGAHRLEAGVEGALNTLDADLDLTGRFGDVVVPIDVPNATMGIEERRSEAFLAHTWRKGRWSTEMRLAGELSRLDFTGDVVQQEELSYLKPSMQVARTFGSAHQVRVRLYRDVEQLDFNDFASAVSLSDEVIDGGNPDLRPGTSWRLEAGVDLQLGKRSALSARLFHDWMDDVVDLVPLGASGVTGPGNIGNGSVHGLQVTFATPLGPLVPGGTLNVDAILQDAEVTDPVTGRERTISDFERNEIRAQFRQDTQRDGFAWGFEYVHTSSTTQYRVDETDWHRDSPSLDVFVERNVTDALKLRVSVVSLLGSPEQRRRSFYDGDRAGALLSVENSDYDPGRWLLITLSGSL